MMTWMRSKIFCTPPDFGGVISPMAKGGARTMSLLPTRAKDPPNTKQETMKGSIRVALVLLCLLVLARGDNTFSSTRKLPLIATRQNLRQLRGGDDPRYDIVQVNPNYLQHKKKPYTLGDLEREQQQPSYYNIEQTQSFAIGPNSQLSLFQLIHLYASHLLRSSPPLFATAAASIGIFFLWQFPSLHATLNRNFVSSRYNIKAGRWYVLLLSAISHSGLLHLAFNLSSLMMLGPKVQQVVERSSLSHRWPVWPLLVGSAISSSAMFLVCEGRYGGGMGLSGVTAALLAVFAMTFPDAVMGILVAGVLPVRMSARQLLQLTFLWSVGGTLLAMKHPQKIAHSAHLGGLLFGLGYYEMWYRRLQRRTMPCRKF